MSYRVGVLGATGAVGSTILQVLAERDFPLSELVPLASGRSAGKRIPFGSGEVEVVEVSDEAIQGLDIVLSSAGGSVSAEWAPKIVQAGAVVVDNTSFWRMHPDVPLVVAEVNPDAANEHSGLIANPNCTTMQMMVALAPIQRRDRDRPPGRLDLPVGVGHRAEGDRGAPGAVARGARRARRPRRTSIRTPSPSTSSRRSRPSRTATTTRPRSEK